MADYIDPVKVSSANYRVVLEDEHTRILEMTLKAGESDVEHSHPTEHVYFITGGSIKIHLPDGGVAEADIPDGHGMWHEAWTHRVENVGKTDIRAVIVEPKG